jgi:hypothetical protein
MRTLLFKLFSLLHGGWRKPKPPVDIEKTLPLEALADVKREASFLRAKFAVEVHSLSEGEIPGAPKRADKL